MDILTKIRDNAGNHYFRAWSENEDAVDITKEWLKAGLTATQDNGLVETIMPLLHIVDRMPLTVNALKKSKLGKIVVKLVKEPPAPGEYISCYRNTSAPASYLSFGTPLENVVMRVSCVCSLDAYLISIPRVIHVRSDMSFAFSIFAFAMCSNQGYGLQSRTKMATAG